MSQSSASTQANQAPSQPGAELSLLSKSEILTCLSDFVEEQRADDTLSWAYTQVAAVNRETVEPHQVGWFPRFEFQGDRLYHIHKYQPTEEIQHSSWCPDLTVRKLCNSPMPYPWLGTLEGKKS